MNGLASEKSTALTSRSIFAVISAISALSVKTMGVGWIRDFAREAWEVAGF
jgi:hypothetical protein